MLVGCKGFFDIDFESYHVVDRTSVGSAVGLDRAIYIVNFHVTNEMHVNNSFK